MKILSLELSGYKRLSLTQIDYIKLTLTAQIQLILGTNGSGKSSILEELGPLPAAAVHYTKNGFKKITIEHNNDLFVLTSTFSPSQRHSFIKNGEELNVGAGTGQIQKELVKQYFNITPDVHELLTGSTNFHAMSSADRRKWFTKLSDTNYTFALSTYQKLKERHRDNQGGVKLIQARLVQENNKLLTPEQEIKYRKEVADLTEALHELLRMKPQAYRDPVQVKRNLSNSDLELNSLILTIRANKAKFLNLENFSSVEDLISATIETKANIQAITYQINDIASQLEKEQDILHALSTCSISNVTDIDTSINNKLVNYNAIKQSIKLPDIIDQFTDITNTFHSLVSISDNVIDVATQIETNDDRRYNRQRYDYLSEQLKQLGNLILSLEVKERILEAKKKELEHYKVHNELECPKCSHKWFKGYGEASYQLVVKDLKEVQDQITTTTQTRTLYTDEHLKITEYLKLLRVYVDISAAWKILDPLWNHCTLEELIFNNPKKIIRLIEVIKGDLLVSMSLDTLKQELTDLYKLKELVAKNTELDINKLKERTDYLNESLFDHNRRLNNQKQLLVTLLSYRDTIDRINESEQRIEAMLNNRAEIHDQLIEVVKTECLNEIIKTVQQELSRKEQLLSQVDVQKGIVRDLANQLKTYEEEALVCKIMVKELSPVDGLIAKGMLGFINVFVKQMNSFIKKVWLYPLELIPVIPDESDGVDLDYKFSVRINNDKDNVIPDIAKTSSAMREIINLAFKIVATSYLKLSDGILVLDELAAAMDAGHRQSAFNAINTLITQSNFSQIFVVSHYSECYGALKNAEITILCPANINIHKDTVFNKHVIMK